MPPNQSVSTRDTLDTTRRRLLASAGVAAGVTVAGCSTRGLFGDREGEGDTIEIIVSNDTAGRAQIAVRVESREGETLFSRVYDLDPGHTDESAGIDSRPFRVTVFTPEGTSRSWEYAPPTDLNCPGEDIGIRLRDPNTVEPWYGC